MIVGNGMLAQALKSSDYDWEDFILLASGVSNSSETRETEYQREKNQITSYLGTHKTVVYFSTVSIYDEQKSESEYVTFKVAIERFILESFERSLVIRLPIVVGPNNNPNQLIGHIKSCIHSGDELTIYKNATRYFFDVGDLARAITDIDKWMRDNGKTQMAINVGFQKQIKMEELAALVLAKHPTLSIQMINKGGSYFVDFSDFEAIVSSKEYVSANAKELIGSFL